MLLLRSILSLSLPLHMVHVHFLVFLAGLHAPYEKADRARCRSFPAVVNQAGSTFNEA